MADDNYYSLTVGLVYLFNLLLGTGVLTMPVVFDQAGYISGIICLTLLCAVSYVQTTFLIESMANANFIKRMQQFNGNITEMSALLSDLDDVQVVEVPRRWPRLATSFRKNKRQHYEEYNEDCSKDHGHDNDDDDDDENGEGQADNVIFNAYICSSTVSNNDASSSRANRQNSSNTHSFNYSSSSFIHQQNLDSDQKKLFYSSTVIANNMSINTAERFNEGAEFDQDDIEPKMIQRTRQNVSMSYQNSSSSMDDDNPDLGSCLSVINHSLERKFNIVDKFELGNMTEMFLHRHLSKFFFVSIISYLFGDLLIYNSMMSKSLRELSCTSKAYCFANDTNDHDHLDYRCWDNVNITRRNAYRLFLLGFIAILGPLTYAKIQKTKIIQIMTIMLRWLAFLSMIGITIKIFVNGQAKSHTKAMNILNVPKLFGICVYSFMCHHSVPSIITPIKNKTKVYTGVILDYVLVLTFYIVIALTAIFAFDKIEQVYTLNFQNDKCSTNHSTTNPASIPGFDIFLPTFPIFTLFSSYTILALTLINNIKVLINFREEMKHAKWIAYSLPLIAIIPPLTIALFTEDVSSIVQYVGSYSGTLIQYVYPSLLVYYSRRNVCEKYLRPYIQYRLNLTSSSSTTLLRTNYIQHIYRKLNPFRSFFQSNFWVYATAIWWILCILFVTLDHLREVFDIY